MTMMLAATLVFFVAVLVFASGWRMCSPQNSSIGGAAAVLLFVLHPAVLYDIQNSSPWDALFVMSFVSAWLAMEHWSLFMRSWVLAGIYAFGLWLGSSFVLWGLVAMVPWVVFSRRPLAAVGSLVTVFVGGLVIFSATWGVAWFLIPNLGRPLFTQWIRWGGMSMPLSLSLPWCLLAMSAIIDRVREMLRTRRADAVMFTAFLLLVTALFGSPSLRLSMIALSAPLIATTLVKREFLFHRGVRWAASVTLVLAVVLALVFHQNAWVTTGLAILVVGISTRWFFGRSRLPWDLAAEAVCVGAYLGDSLATLLHLFPA